MGEEGSAILLLMILACLGIFSFRQRNSKQTTENKTKTKPKNTKF